MSGIRRRAIYERVVNQNNHLVRKVEQAADLLRPVYEADPKVREWFGHQGYNDPRSGGDISQLKAPVKP